MSTISASTRFDNGLEVANVLVKIEGRDESDRKAALNIDGAVGSSDGAR